MLFFCWSFYLILRFQFCFTWFMSILISSGADFNYFPLLWRFHLLQPHCYFFNYSCHFIANIFSLSSAIAQCLELDFDFHLKCANVIFNSEKSTSCANIFNGNILDYFGFFIDIISNWFLNFDVNFTFSYVFLSYLVVKVLEF